MNSFTEEDREFELIVLSAARKNALIAANPRRKFVDTVLQRELWKSLRATFQVRLNESSSKMDSFESAEDTTLTRQDGLDYSEEQVLPTPTTIDFSGSGSAALASSSNSSISASSASSSDDEVDPFVLQEPDLVPMSVLSSHDPMLVPTDALGGDFEKFPDSDAAQPGTLEAIVPDNAAPEGLKRGADGNIAFCTRAKRATMQDENAWLLPAGKAVQDNWSLQNCSLSLPHLPFVNTYHAAWSGAEVATGTSSISNSSSSGNYSIINNAASAPRESEYGCQMLFGCRTILPAMMVLQEIAGPQEAVAY